MWNTAGGNCLDASCTGRHWHILRNGAEVALPVKFGQAGMDSMRIDGGHLAMEFWSSRSVQQIHFDDLPHGNAHWVICQMNCPP